MSRRQGIAEIMPNREAFIMAKKNIEKNVNLTAEETRLEAALFALAKAGRHDLIEPAIKAANMAISEDDHKAAKPLTAEDMAKAALLEAGIDIASLEPVKATSKALTDSLKGLWLEIMPDKSADKQGTAFCNYFMTSKVKAGETVKKADLLAFVQKEYRSHYVNVGHYATWLKRLSDEKVPHTKGSGFFRVTA